MSRDENYCSIFSAVSGTDLEKSFPQPHFSGSDSWVDGLRWDDLISLRSPWFVHAQIATITALTVVKLAARHNLVLSDRDMRNVMLTGVGESDGHTIFRTGRGEMSVVQIDFGEVYEYESGSNRKVENTLLDLFSQVGSTDFERHARKVIESVRSNQLKNAQGDLESSLRAFRAKSAILSYSKDDLRNIARFRDIVDSL